MQWKKAAVIPVVAAACLSASSASASAAGDSVSLPKGGGGASVPVIKVVDLHRAYLRALPDARHGAVVDKLRPRGRRTAVRGSAGPASCVEPNCDVSYNGGSVQHDPHVYLLLWGPQWQASSPDTEYLASFYQGLGVGPQDTWSAVTGQYGDGSGHPAFGGSVLEGVFQDATAPPADVSETDLTAEADAFVTGQGVTDLPAAQVVIASQSGTCFGDGFAGNPAGCSSSLPAYCGWHSSSGLGETFTNLPYQLDAGYSCGEDFINAGSAGAYDGFSVVGGHEYAESITDPAPYGGWWDSSDNVSGGEVADKCAWAGELWGTPDPAGDVTLSTGSFAMQSLWSNAAGGCVMSAPATAPPAVTGVSPDHGPAAGGTAVTVTGTGLSGAAVRFGSSPATRVSCRAASCSATSPAGTGTVDVRVTTPGGTSAISSADHFTYASAPPAGPITGYRGKCLADAGRLSRSGNAVELWACKPSAGQRWTVETGGTLRMAGKCMTVRSARAANGSKIEVSACSGTWRQVWLRGSDGELVNKRSGKCLTDPGYRTANGTRVVLQPCKARPSQLWRIP